MKTRLTILSTAIALSIAPATAQEIDGMDPQTRALLNIDRDMQAQTRAIESLPLANAEINLFLQNGRDLGRGYTPIMSQTDF